MRLLRSLPDKAWTKIFNAKNYAEHYGLGFNHAWVLFRKEDFDRSLVLFAASFSYNHCRRCSLLGISHSMDIEARNGPSEILPHYGSPRSPRTPISLFTLTVFVIGLILGTATTYHFRHAFLWVDEGEYPTLGLAGCSANLTTLGVAVEAYAKNNGHYPQSQHDLVPDYLKEIPLCPVVQRATYRTSFGPEIARHPTTNPNYFVVECCGANHRNVRVAANFPAYDNVSGLQMKRQWWGR